VESQHDSGHAAKRTQLTSPDLNPSLALRREPYLHRLVSARDLQLQPPRGSTAWPPTGRRPRA